MASRPPSAPAVEQVRERLAHAVALVIQRENLDALHLRQLADFLDFGNDPVGDVDQIGAGCLADRNADRVVTIQVTTVVAFRRAQLDIGDIAEAQPGLIDREVHESHRPM